MTSTLTIPAGTQIVGEAWSVIAGKGSAFQNQASPQVVVQVGAPGSQGVVEITDILFSTIGPGTVPVLDHRAPKCLRRCVSDAGAIVVEWNVKQPNGQNGGAGMWDSHIRFSFLFCLTLI